MIRRIAAAAVVALALAACGGAPDVPHAVSSQSDTHCLSCHLEGLNAATRTPHPENPNCVSCHTPVGEVDVGAVRLLPGR